jgi:hypothetical protein
MPITEVRLTFRTENDKSVKLFIPSNSSFDEALSMMTDLEVMMV